LRFWGAWTVSPKVQSMLAAIFLNMEWSRETKHWQVLDGNAARIDELALALPAHQRVLDEYVRFLYLIGEQSLPRAFLTVAEILKRGDASALLSQSNTIFCLGRILQQHVYGAPRALKANAELQAAVLELLDHLVEAGSSAAYRMRDDFVTPLAE